MENCAPVENVSYYTQYQIKCIEDLEKELILEGKRREVSDEDLKKKLLGAVIKLDIGVNDENLDELCILAYLPSWANIRTSQSPHIKAGREWIRNEE